jgi:outer membrane lipoprotein LolB
MRRALLILMVAVAGCATLPPAPPPGDWAARQAELLSLDAWRMTGRVAVSVDGEGASAGIDWRQAGATTDLAVSGPLGVGTLRAVLDASGLLLEDAGGARVTGEDAERLLRERLGAELPLHSLRYWLLGTPAPGMPFDATTAPGGRPDSFRQAGWQVEITRFGATSGGELPTRLTLLRDGARLRLAISRWELPR